MMSTHSRLSSLLSRERALRSTATTSERGDTNNQQSSSSIGFSTSSTANNTRTTEKKIFPALSEVDKTPVTSPENIETTKRRVSRLLAKQSIDDPQPEPQPERWKGSVSQSLYEQLESSDNSVVMTPRGRKKLSKEKAVVADSPERKIISRSLSPSPRYKATSSRVSSEADRHKFNTKYNHSKRLDVSRVSIPTREVPIQLNKADQNYTNDSIFGLDISIYEEVDQHINEDLAVIGSLENATTIHRKFQSSVMQLKKVGLIDTQLWLYDDSSGSLYTTRSDGKKVFLDSNETEILLKYTKEIAQSTPNSYNDANGTNRYYSNGYGTFILTPESSSWAAIHKTMSNNYDIDFSGKSNSTQWEKIHVHLFDNYNSNTNSDVSYGLILSAEVNSNILPFTSYHGIKQSNCNRMKQYLLQQLLTKLSLVINSRVKYLHNLLTIKRHEVYDSEEKITSTKNYYKEKEDLLITNYESKITSLGNNFEQQIVSINEQNDLRNNLVEKENEMKLQQKEAEIVLLTKNYDNEVTMIKNQYNEIINKRQREFSRQLYTIKQFIDEQLRKYFKMFEQLQRKSHNSLLKNEGKIVVLTEKVSLLKSYIYQLLTENKNLLIAINKLQENHSLSKINNEVKNNNLYSELLSKESLLNCSIDIKSSNYNSVLMVASAIAKTVSYFQDFTKPPSCWVLLQELSNSYHANSGKDNRLVNIVAGHILNNDNNAYSSRESSKLIHDLFGEVSTQPFIVEARSSFELHDSGLIGNSSVSTSGLSSSSAAATENHIKLLSISFRINSMESMKNSTGHGLIRVAIVMTMPNEFPEELLRSHLLGMQQIFSSSMHSINSHLHQHSLMSMMKSANRLLGSFSSVNNTSDLLFPYAKLMSKISSSDFSEGLGISHAHLVMSTGYRSCITTDSLSYQSTDQPIGFLALDANDEMQPLNSEILTSETIWYQELLTGKVVAFTNDITGQTNNPNSFSPSRFESGIEREDIYLHSQDYLKLATHSNGKLHEFIREIDPIASVALLVPVRTKKGLLILILIGKDYEETQTIASSSSSSVTSYKSHLLLSNKYIETLYQSGICNNIISCLTVIENTSKEKELLLSQENQILQIEEKLSDSKISMDKAIENCIKEKKRSLKQKVFLKWKGCVAPKPTKVVVPERSMNSEVLRATLKMINFSRDAAKEADLLTIFLSVLEEELSNLFPNDAIVVKDLRVNEVLHDNFISTIDQLNVKASFGDAITIYEDSLRSYMMFGIKSIDINEDGEQSLIATVRISRPATQKQSIFFLQEEQLVLLDLCRIASEILHSINYCKKDPPPPEEFSARAYPLITKLIPLFLHIIANHNQNSELNLQQLLPIISYSLKKICHAETVLIRLYPETIAEMQNNELISSSEEINEENFNKLVNKYFNYLRNDIVTDHLNNSFSLKIIYDTIDEVNDTKTMITTGEINLFGSDGKVFTNDNHYFVHLITNILGKIVSNKKQFYRVKELKDNTSIELEIVQNENNDLAIKNTQLTNQVENSSQLLNRVVEILLFLTKMINSESLVAIATLIKTLLPQVFHVDTVQLLLYNRNDYEEYFSSINEQDVANSESFDEELRMYKRQVDQVDNFFTNSIQLQTKIVLLTPKKEIYGVLLCNKKIKAVSWNNFELIVTDSLSTVIHSAITKINLSMKANEVSEKLSIVDTELRKKGEVEVINDKLSHVKRSLESERETMLLELESVKKENQKQLQNYENQIFNLQEEINYISKENGINSEKLIKKNKLLMNNLTEEISMKNGMEEIKNSLLTMVTQYSFDNRCRDELVINWLKDISIGNNLEFIVIKQMNGGILHGGNRIKGIIASAGESVRTKKTVVFRTTYDNLLYEKNRTIYEKQNSYGISTETKRDKIIADESAGDEIKLADTSLFSDTKVLVCCIPNRFIDAHVDSDYACFAFVYLLPNEGNTTISSSVTVKDSNSDDDGNYFNANLRDYLNVAVNLTCKTLQKSLVKYSVESFHTIERDYHQEKALKSKLQEAIKKTESFRTKKYKSRNDVAKTIESIITEMLTRGKNDSCCIECSTWFSPVVSNNENNNINNLLLINSFESDADIFNKSLSTRKAIRKGSLLWYPIVTGNAIIALVKVERKLILDAVDNYEENLQRKSENFNPDSTSIIDLFLSEVDETVVSAVCQLMTFQFEKFDYISDAYHGVQQASQAIVALQDFQKELENSLAIELASRYQIEEALKAGTQMLGMTCSFRMSTRQLLDEVRKIVISLTSSVQAFVIFPHSIDEHHEQDSNDSSSSADDNYYTLLADQPNLLEVIFEGGDLELRALESLRTHATPEVSDDNADAGHYWQTWTIRKIQSDSTTPRNPADWFSLIVPFQLRNGKRAVLSLARNSAAYTTVDLECIKWISKILSYSLELKGDNLTLEETHQSIKYLQGEVMRLSDLDNQLANFELDTESLEHTLYAADVLNNSYFDSVIATAQNKSVSKSIEKIEEEIIFNSFRYIFGDVNFQLWPADVAKSSYGVTLPLDKYEMKLQKGIEKVINGNVVTDNGKITFWIDGSNANYDGLDFFKMMQYNKQRLVNSPDREHQQDATHFDSVVSITCYFVLQVKGYGLSWIKIGPKSKLPINYKLRLLILMRLLEVHYQWQHRVESIVSSHTEVQKSFDEEKLNYLNELQLRAADVQRLQNMYVEGNETSKDEQKQLLQHKRLVRKMVERVHHEAAVQCNELLGVSSAKLKNNDVQYFQNIGQTIIEGARSIVSHTSCEVHAMIYTSNRETKQSTITWLTDKLVLEMYVEKAASIRNAPQLENIVEIVNHNRLLVLLQESMEENYVEYLTNSVGAVCTSLADGLTLSITRGPMSTNFFFLPFPVDRGKTLILMVNIRSIFDKGMRSVCISKHVVNASIAALTLLRSTVVHILSTKTELLELVDRCKNVSTLILSQVTSNRTIEQLNKQLSFEKLKNNKLETKLGSAESNLIELSLIRNRIRYLEQSSADWKELVKGINGSTLSIARGIPSLWAQSCSVLISILTSKISISGCGLIVKNDDNILEEFCVKELSTPVIDRHNFHDITNESLYLDSSNANDDAITNYIRGMLELRLASDLGAVVESLAVDIINGNSGQQRSFKLVRPSAGKEESLWLVPIRTARAVLAVLRVSVHEVDVNENRQGGVPDSAVKAGLSIDGGKKVDVNLVSEMIQNSMINFAELLAPLVVAAECIEKERLLKLKAESSKDETGATLRKAMDEASLTAKSMNTFSAAIQSITSRDVMKYLHQNNLQEICQKIVNNVSEALAVTAVIKIESEPSAIRSERNFVERNPLEVSESLVDSTGKAIGSMSLIFEQISEPINSSFALDDEAMYNKTTSNEYDRNKYLNMTKVMRVVGSIVSSIVSSVQNNQRTTGRITSLSEELHIAENQLETAKVAIESLHQKEAELISIRDGYQSINTILSMCLSGKIHAGNTNKTVDILHIMSTKLAEIAGVSGGFNFILVDNDKEEELDEILVSSEHDQLRLLKKKLKWISDGVGSSPAVNENIREIGLNLAITCIEKKIKNVFDIGLPTGSGNFRRGLAGVDTTINFDQSLVYDNERDTTLRILTYPLGNDRDNKCFGCLQVIVDTLVDTSKLDYYCEEAAIASTYILSSHSINKLHTSQQQSLEVDLVLTETKKNEFEVLKEMWEQRANAWQAVATVASILSRECVRDAPYMNVLQSESIASALYNSGIHIVLHIKGKTFSTGLSIPVTDNCAARAVIPIDGSNKSTVEILCDNRIKSTFYNTDANGIATIAVDVVEKLSNVIQNTLLIHSTKSAELDATIKERTYAEEKIEKLKQSVKVAKDELNKSMITRSSASNEYLQVVQFLEKYKQHVHGGMNEFIMPLVIELCTVFEQVNSQVLLYKNNITKLLDWNWNSLVRIADKAIQKISSGSFTYHISILLRMEVVGEKATEVPVASTDVKKKEAKKSKSETAKANTPSKPKSSPYMDKIDVKVYGNPSTINNIYTIDPSQTSGYYGHLTKEKSSKSNKAKRLLHTTSVLLKCFSVGTIQESIDELLPSDLVGIDPTVIPTIVDDEERIPSVLAIPILGQKGAVTAIVRLVYSKPPLVQKTKSKKEMIPTMAGEEEVKANTTKAIKSVSNTNTANQPGIKDIENFNNSLIVPVLEIIMMFGNVLSQLLLASSSRYNEVTNFSAEKDEVKAKAEEVQFLLERSRKMHRIICRESSILLDPPMIGPPGGIAPRAVHPAALTPLSASQDTCLKLLSMLRTLLRSEGQALLLRDSSTDPTTFQIIYTGDALYWPGIEQGTFGIVASSSPSRTSLIETVMNTRKPIAVSNATSDTRYCAYLDGICTNGTPVIVAPIRGRSGVVVGALVAARGKESNIFTVEDVSALEMISSFGSLSLYWCQGLGSLHHQLTKNINKMTQLERIVQKMNTKVNK